MTTAPAPTAQPCAPDSKCAADQSPDPCGPASAPQTTRRAPPTHATSAEQSCPDPPLRCSGQRRTKPSVPANRAGKLLPACTGGKYWAKLLWFRYPTNGWEESSILHCDIFPPCARSTSRYRASSARVSRAECEGSYLLGALPRLHESVRHHSRARGFMSSLRKRFLIPAACYEFRTNFAPRLARRNADIDLGRQNRLGIGPSHRAPRFVRIS